MKPFQGNTPRPPKRDFSKPVVVNAPPRPATVMRAESAAKIAPARAGAFHILSKIATSAAHSDDLLHSVAVNALSPEDRNLTTALVLGVLRWQLHLDALLRPMLQRPDAELHPAARLALRMGLFQLLFMDRIPPHAALNDSVELARANGADHAAGMVNAILRRVSREKGTEAKRNTLAVALTPAEQSHPDWMLARWRANFGGALARRIAEYDQNEPPAHALFLPDERLPDIDDGSRLVAEIAAAAVPAPKRVLDCCAAPGGKTAVLAVRHTDADVVAADVSEKRLAAMRTRMDRQPVTARVGTVTVDMTAAAEVARLKAGFDLILCDAPCSGTGTLARNPEIRHRLRSSDLQRQADRQRSIVTNALTLLAPGGRLVYSTCSLEPEENAGVVSAVLKAAPEMRLVPTRELLASVPSLLEDERAQIAKGIAEDGTLRTLPGWQPCDGFFIAVLERAE